MKVSARYAGWALLLLLIPAPAVILHSYLDAKADDGQRVTALPIALAGYTGTPTRRTKVWGGQIFGTDDWIEREYAGTDSGRLLFFAARGYDHKRLYHHPELAVLYGHDLEDLGIEPMPGATGIPVHWLASRKGTGLAGYVLLYDGRYITEPIGFQIRTAFETLVSPRKAMTILLVWDPAARGTDAAARQPLSQLLAAALGSWQPRSAPPL